MPLLERLVSHVFCGNLQKLYFPANFLLHNLQAQKLRSCPHMSTSLEKTSFSAVDPDMHFLVTGLLADSMLLPDLHDGGFNKPVLGLPPWIPCLPSAHETGDIFSMHVLDNLLPPEEGLPTPASPTLPVSFAAIHLPVADFSAAAVTMVNAWPDHLYLVNRFGEDAASTGCPLQLEFIIRGTPVILDVLPPGATGISGVIYANHITVDIVMMDNRVPKVWDAAIGKFGFVQQPVVRCLGYNSASGVLRLSLERRAWPHSSAHGNSPLKFVFHMGPHIYVTPPAYVTSKESKTGRTKYSPTDLPVPEQIAPCPLPPIRKSILRRVLKRTLDCEECVIPSETPQQHTAAPFKRSARRTTKL